MTLTMRMRMMRSSSVLLLALLLLGAETQGAVTCKASTTVEQTTVTCYFGMDISKTSHNFNVQYYAPNAKNDPESVLMCNWKTPTELTCKQSSDVTFDRVVSNQITLHRWPSVGIWGSRYVCQLVPSTGDPLDPCELTFSNVKAAAHPTSTTTASSMLDVKAAARPTSITTAFSMLEGILESSREIRIISILALIIGVILLLAIIAFTVFFIFFYRRRMAKKAARRGASVTGIEMEQPLQHPVSLVEPMPWDNNAENMKEGKQKKWYQFWKSSKSKKTHEDEHLMASIEEATPRNAQPARSKSSEMSEAVKKTTVETQEPPSNLQPNKTAPEESSSGKENGKKGNKKGKK